MNLRKYEDIALSNKDIFKLLNGKVKIVVYPDLYKYNTLDQVMGPHKACILLFEARKNYGHWVCIFKLNENTVEFFNPYGGFPDDSLKFINQDFRKETHQDIPILSQLMIDSRYKLTYNEFIFQQHSKDIKTCGRHCVVRLLFRDLSLYEYEELLKYISDQTNLNYDEIVTLLTI
jgi:hypothetical protein